MLEKFSVVIPQETVNDESVKILSWKVKSGSRVEKDQLICEVETSKTVMEIRAPGGGIARYAAVAGEEVLIGAILCEIVPEAEEGAESGPGSPAPGQQSGLPAGETPPARLTPLARKIAAEHGIDQAAFPPGILVRSRDVLRKAGKFTPETEVRPTPIHSGERPAAEENRRVENAPVTGVPVDWIDLPRKKVLEGRILGVGRAACIQSSVTSICRAPCLRPEANTPGLAAVGRSALIIYEAARLLCKYPMFNSVYNRERIGQYQAVNVGWAIDGGQGLVVPVIKDADQKKLAEIAGIMERHIEGYLTNSLTPADFLGGTFTVSDLSGEGISFFHPLIGKGQSAILGIGNGMADRKDKFLYLTLAFDHQVAEGRIAAQFVRDLSERLEAHAENERKAEKSFPASESETYCVLCQRDGKALGKLNAVLVRAELPPGLVCSICLAGYR